MQPPSDTELLVLWEQGLSRHPIDRALLLGARARPDLRPECVADLPLGALGAALLGLRMDLFGAHFTGYADCPDCGERVALTLDLRKLMTDVATPDTTREIEIGGLRLRAPTSRDLAAVADAPDPGAAAVRMLRRLTRDAATGAPTDLGDAVLADLLPAVEQALDTLDPGAEIALALVCESCGHRWLADLDPAALLWDEIATSAGALLQDVHSLASAYGWSEPEVLALSSARRAVYLGLVGAA